jgi:uncharacterized protein
MTTITLVGARTVAGGDLTAKERRLVELLREPARLLVAYSGGVDSAFLLAAAHRALGDAALGVIAKSPSLPTSELEGALESARRHGIPVRVIETREMERAEYRANGPDRCFHCKTELFEQMTALAKSEGWPSLAYGAVTDDLGDDRPGMAAALAHGIRAPLIEAGLSKLEVRSLSRQMGLRVWDKPQSACLASRIPHGSVVTAEKLRQVEEAELWIRERYGVRILRVRHEGATARLETEQADIPRLTASIEALRRELARWGFFDVEVDPRGYRRQDPLPVEKMEVTPHVQRR